MAGYEKRTKVVKEILDDGFGPSPIFDNAEKNGTILPEVKLDKPESEEKFDDIDLSDPKKVQKSTNQAKSGTYSVGTGLIVLGAVLLALSGVGLIGELVVGIGILLLGGIIDFGRALYDWLSATKLGNSQKAVETNHEPLPFNELRISEKMEVAVLKQNVKKEEQTSSYVDGDPIEVITNNDGSDDGSNEPPKPTM